MTFEELLDQAIALLQRRGRLTYRAFKRQFNLDDDYLEDLKAELIQGQRLAVDENGEVLVWTGGAEGHPARGASPPPAAGEAVTARRADWHPYGTGRDGGDRRQWATRIPCPGGNAQRCGPDTRRGYSRYHCH
jgi:hypothetical protein